MIENHIHPLEVFNIRKWEFLIFLHVELGKVEDFYRERENAAGQRLEALRQQLHVMVQKRAEELGDLTRLRSKLAGFETRYKAKLHIHLDLDLKHKFVSKSPSLKKTQSKMNAPTSNLEAEKAWRRDFFDTSPRTVDSNPDEKVSYRAAKHRLRVALQERHGSLDLLKSYALLNRTAFRKLNKKYEKTTDYNIRLKLRWFTENVDKSYFVNSETLNSYLEAVEDSYARYFERGNHKLAAGKLRELNKPHGDKSESALLNGILMGVRLLFTIEGTWGRVHASLQRRWNGARAYRFSLDAIYRLFPYVVSFHVVLHWLSHLDQISDQLCFHLRIWQETWPGLEAIVEISVCMLAAAGRLYVLEFLKLVGPESRCLIPVVPSGTLWSHASDHILTSASLLVEKSVVVC